MNKRAVFYIIDALVFASLILAAIYLFPSYTAAPSPNPSTLIAKDIVGVLEAMKVGELDDTWVSQHVADGSIKNVNASVLEFLGELWASDKEILAAEVLQQVDDKIPQHVGFGVWVGGDVLFARTMPPTRYVSSGWRMVSGIDKGKPVRGYVSSARATSLRGNSTSVITFSPEGSGWQNGQVIVVRNINTSAMNISSAEIFLPINSGIQSMDIEVDLNNGLCHYTDADLPRGSDGEVTGMLVTACMVQGINRFELRMRNPGYHSYTLPGMQLVINYSSDMPLEVQSTQVNQRIWIDSIRSNEAGGAGAGAWTTVPFHIPRSARDVRVSAQIVGRNVFDYAGNQKFDDWNNQKRPEKSSDYLVFLNGGDPIHELASPPLNPLYYYTNATLGPRVIPGTNVLSVYLNCYADTAWGRNWVEIYSDPIGDPAHSSYIDVNYSIPSRVPYGMIQLSQVQSFTGPNDEDKTASFTYPVQAALKGDAFVHVAQDYSSRMTVWADMYNPPAYQQYRSASVREIPSSVYLDSDYFGLSHSINNFVRVRNEGASNEIIAAHTRIEYRYFVPAFVGYGGVFDSEEEAREDAEDRLADSMGDSLTAGGIVTDVSSITDVPSLWGPTIVEVRAWK